MYLFNECRYPGCRTFAISSIANGAIVDSKEGFCLKHSPSPEKNVEDIKKYIQDNEKIVGINASYISLDDIDLSGKKFYGCNFQHSSFNSIHSTGMRARMCMFDFSTFSECSFMNSNIQFSSFAGSKMVHTIFTGSDLIQNNFNGITAYQSSFDDSDLYNSRFIKAVLINTSMINCNLKKAAFYESAREGVSFKLSNTREALIDRKQNNGSDFYGFDNETTTETL